MKAQILKIAGVKSEKEFYKKYPSEEAFMKQHGKAFKKAKMGSIISGGDKTSNPNVINLRTMYDQADMDVTGMTDEMRQKQAAAYQAAQASTAAPAGGGGGGLGSIMSMLGGSGGGEGGGGLMSMLGGSGAEGGGAEGMMSMLGGARYGADIPRAQVGINMPSWYQNNPAAMQQSYQQPSVGTNPKFPKPPVNNDFETPSVVGQPYQGPTNQELVNQGAQITGDTTNVAAKETGGMEGVLGGIAKYAGPAGKLFEGYQALRGERRARKEAEQQKAVSDITLKASQTRPEEIKRKYVRPEDIQNTGEEFFPIYGVGTNPLARNGIRLQDGGGIGGNPTEIQNTYNDGYDIYTDGGYEPLNDSNQVKSFYHGGRLHSMQDGGNFDWASAGNIGSDIAGQASGGPNAGGDIGGQLGGTAGEAIGNAIAPGVGGKVGKAVGQVGGTLAGQFLDTNPKATKAFQAGAKRNVTMMGLNSGFQGVQAQNASYVRDGGDIPNYEDGGYMNPEYNPQVITMFGDHNAEDFADYAHKFRAGGHLKSYTPPSERAMEIYEDGGDVKPYGLGGELQTHWGGGAETISRNPYLPGTGETVMFRGKSHEEYSPNGETGIGVTYGGNPVEVERGEPMVELEEGGVVDPMTGEVQKSGVVFGNLKIPNQYIDLLGDKSAKGKKFKNYVADLSKTETRQNKIIEKSTNELDGFEPITSFDKLKLSALEANIQGANMKLKDIADKKINAASLQNAINDTAEEHGVVADDLARGIVKIDKEAMKSKEARWGTTVTKAKDGVTTTKETTVIPKKSKEQLKAEGYVLGSDGKYHLKKKGVAKPDVETKSASAMDVIPKQSIDKATGLYGGVTPEQFQAYKEKNKWYDWTGFDPNKIEDVDKYAKAFNVESEKRGSKARILPDVEFDPKTKKSVPGTKTKFVGKQLTSAIIEDAKKSQPAPEEELLAEEDVPDVIGKAKTKFPWQIPANALLNYIRPSDQEALDMAQLYPEMYAMSSNQLEPVPAQGYQPDLGVPYDISFQDQLNANQADYRAAQRNMGYNPAAQANLNAQKYQANQQVLGSQFRANQEMKDKVYGENRNILNDAKLKNLGIYDRQYERQAQALSNTKATTQAALNSIADKYAKNKLENRTLGVYENMYNYRFGKSGRAQNWNGLQFFDTDIAGAQARNDEGIPEGYRVTGYDKNRNPRLERITEKDTKEEDDALEAIGGIKNKNGGTHKKNYKNSSVVRAYKNL